MSASRSFKRYIPKHRSKTVILIALLCTSFGRSQQETLPLKEAYEMAETNYPLIKDLPLLEEVSKANMALLNKKRLPTLNLVGMGQVQSENISIGGNVPNSPINIDAPLETYRGYLDLNFNLFDGGMTKADKQAETSRLQVNKQALRVNLRNLKDQVNHLFLTVLLLKQQKGLLALSLKNIDSNIETLQAGFDNGTVLESELAKLQVRKIELESEEINLRGNIDANLEVLSTLLGTSFSNTTKLVLPTELFEQQHFKISRPEQQLFDDQSNLLEAQKGKINASRLPKLSLFAQGGVGYPNPVNFADISTSTYGLGGLRLNWNVFDWGIAKREKNKLDLQKQRVSINSEVFEFNIKKRENEYLEKLTSLERQIEKDGQIVALQSKILEQSAVQLKEGVINSNDYLTQVNAELAARQQLELHLVQKQKLQIEYLTLFGKL